MTTQTKKPTALFPDIPRGQPIVDKNGQLTASWNFALNNVFQGLQTNYSNEGLLFPALSASDMATIQANYSTLINSELPQTLPDISGKTVFNTTTRSPYQFIITYDASTPPKISTAAWIQFTMILTFAGNPNGNVGGALHWICFDTTDMGLWVCTTAGSANGTPAPQAIWSSSNAFLLL